MNSPSRVACGHVAHTGCNVSATNLTGYTGTNLTFYGPAIPTGTVLTCDLASGYNGTQRVQRHTHTIHRRLLQNEVMMWYFGSHN